jgi:protein arginine kinase activator
MKCDSCGERDATIEYREMREGETTTYHLCKECAKEKGLEAPPPKADYSISSILVSMVEGSGSPDKKEAKEHRCPQCGLSYAEFARDGKLGCAGCYPAFRVQLEPLLRRVHGATSHVGKTIRAASETSKTKREIRKLERALKQAIDNEAFEDAAGIRDKIRRLEGDLFTSHASPESASAGTAEETE